MFAHMEKTYIGVSAGESLGGAVSHHLGVERLNPLLFHWLGHPRQLHFAFERWDLRYHLLLEYSSCVQDCAENKLLVPFVDCDSANLGSITSKALPDCLQLFWPFVVKNFSERVEIDPSCRTTKVAKRSSLRNRYLRKPIIKIQLLTLKDGTLEKVFHESELNYPLSDPIENPCPELPLYKKDDIEILKEMKGDTLKGDTFKARIQGKTCCVKVSDKKGLQREIAALTKMPRLPNLIPGLLGVVDAGQGRIDQLVIPFIFGKDLDSIESCSLVQKVEWKTQITDAIQVLHKHDIVWGDGTVWNVLIEEDTGQAVLIDFDLALCKGCDNETDEHYEEMKAYDLMVLEKLMKHIDNIKASPEG
eukprot:Plantae.Rhodophyta-Hildenbrandia_rubra.ctg5150.p1 GENE.Plantae.Rhodophyta-Hildenbrandia_rubra.ctg5150~~Plantae.Rhodophyta-Hildenbrandia_rubra.ctg5150.p1  ORF type:complete len:361 (+),score=36.11 Plantae.Rhodophyta-Hildenbrandia_rubra.ctg5150:1198-2280(+)